MPPHIIVLVGGIANGKSELAAAMAAELRRRGRRVCVALEPVDLWRRTGILEAFYADIPRYAYAFQTFVTVTRVDAILAALAGCPDPDVLILDGAPPSDSVFMAMLSGDLSPAERAMYEVWRDGWVRLLPFDLADATALYLRTSMAESMRRLSARGRAEEVSPCSRDEDLQAVPAAGGVTLEYQEKLRRAFDAFLVGGPAGEFPTLRPHRFRRVEVVGPALADADYRAGAPAAGAVVNEILRQVYI